MVRVFIGGVVLNLVGVEYDDAGPVAFAQLAAAFEVEGVGGQASGRETGGEGRPCEESRFQQASKARLNGGAFGGTV
jgi:hypothetical protein